MVLLTLPQRSRSLDFQVRNSERNCKPGKFVTSCSGRLRISSAQGAALRGREGRVDEPRWYLHLRRQRERIPRHHWQARWERSSYPSQGLREQVSSQILGTPQTRPSFFIKSESFRYGLDDSTRLLKISKIFSFDRTSRKSPVSIH